MHFILRILDTVHLKRLLCNLFSIFHLMCFSHFQIFPFPIPNHIFLSPALQLFSRITSPPFLISLATLFFAKSKTIFKNIRKEGVSVFQIEFDYKSSNPSSHSTRVVLVLWDTFQYWPLLYGESMLTSQRSGWPAWVRVIRRLYWFTLLLLLLSNCRHWTLHNLPSLSVNLDLTSHQKWFAWGEILLCQKEEKTLFGLFHFLVFPVRGGTTLWCSNG